MKLIKMIWIAGIAGAVVLLVPALAGVLRANESSVVAGAAVPAPEEIDIPLPAIEYDPGVSASYPVLGASRDPSDRDS